MKQSQKTILLWVLLILMFVSIYHLFTEGGTKDEEKDVTAFKAEIADTEKVKTIEKVAIEPRGRDDARYVVTYRAGGPKTVVNGPYSGAGNEITRALDAQGITWSVKAKEESAFWQSLVISWLPMLFLFVIFFFFMRQLQAGGG